MGDVTNHLPSLSLLSLLFLSSPLRFPRPRRKGIHLPLPTYSYSFLTPLNIHASMLFLFISTMILNPCTHDPCTHAFLRSSPHLLASPPPVPLFIATFFLLLWAGNPAALHSWLSPPLSLLSPPFFPLSSFYVVRPPTRHPGITLFSFLLF